MSLVAERWFLAMRCCCSSRRPSGSGSSSSMFTKPVWALPLTDIIEELAVRVFVGVPARIGQPTRPCVGRAHGSRTQPPAQLAERVLSTVDPSWSVLQGFALGLTLPPKLCKPLLTRNLGAAV